MLFGKNLVLLKVSCLAEYSIHIIKHLTCEDTMHIITIAFLIYFILWLQYWPILPPIAEVMNIKTNSKCLFYI